MTYLEYLKAYRNFDDYLLFLDYLGFSATEISSLTNSSRQSLYNARHRQEWIIKTLEEVKVLNKGEKYGRE